MNKIFQEGDNVERRESKPSLGLIISLIKSDDSSVSISVPPAWNTKDMVYVVNIFKDSKYFFPMDIWSDKSSFDASNQPLTLSEIVSK